MDVATEVHDETLIHRVSGRIDTSTAADAEHKLTAEVRQGRRVVLDMTRVAYVSSAGLRVVLMAATLKPGRIDEIKPRQLVASYR